MGIISILNENQGATNAILATALVLVNIFLVIATWSYARKTSESIEILRKDKERPKILDEVQFVLTPVINLLRTVIGAIETNDIFWNISPALSMFNRLDEIKVGIKEQNHALRDVFRKNPKLEEKFNLHNGLYRQIVGLYMNLDSSIGTKEVIEKIHEFIGKFNERSHDRIPLDTDRIFVNAIINKHILLNVLRTVSPSPPDPRRDFWKHYGDELMKFRDNSETKGIDKKIEETFNEIIKTDREIVKILEDIRENYRVKYDLTQNEVDKEEIIKEQKYL